MNLKKTEAIHKEQMSKSQEKAKQNGAKPQWGQKSAPKRCQPWWGSWDRDPSTHPGFCPSYIDSERPRMEAHGQILHYGVPKTLS